MGRNCIPAADTVWKTASVNAAAPGDIGGGVSGAPRDGVRVPCSIARMRSTIEERVIADVTSLLLRIIANACSALPLSNCLYNFPHLRTQKQNLFMDTPYTCHTASLPKDGAEVVP